MSHCSTTWSVTPKILQRSFTDVPPKPSSLSDKRMTGRRHYLLLRLLIGLITGIFLLLIHTGPCPALQTVCDRVNLYLPGRLGCTSTTWQEAKPDYDRLADDHRRLERVPSYVYKYAPYVHLYSDEKYWPCDIAEHLPNIIPELDYTPIKSLGEALTLTNLDALNSYGDGRHTYLTSKNDVEDDPKWLLGEKNIPNNKTRSAKCRGHNDTYQAGLSRAPAVLIAIDKGDGIVDAFWFFFYSYNLGNVVFNVRWGNHVGDWEHTLVRFYHGVPQAIFCSEHFFGKAYTYNAVEKIGRRPVVYSATGTHAMYATPGYHPYVLPLGLLHDQTDQGPLWDPALNVLSYTYALPQSILSADPVRSPHAPTNWFYYNGHWGDRAYPLNDKRQYGLIGEFHYVSGPLGPRFKNLGRKKVCQGRDSDTCIIKDELEPVMAEAEAEVDWDRG